MKKILLFTSAIALMMSCTKTELGTDAQIPENAKGVKFSTSIDDNGVGTKAEFAPFNNVFNLKWHADHDGIGVFYKKDCYVAPSTGAGLAIGGNGGWMGLDDASNSKAFEFKASASGVAGYFVASNDANVLLLSKPDATYDDKKAPAFRAFWPLTGINFAADGKFGLIDIKEQYQTDIYGNGIVRNSFMVSETKYSKEKPGYSESDNSISKDRFELAFKRVSPILYFKIKTSSDKDGNANREYVRDYASSMFSNFGPLKSIQLTALGVDGNIGGDTDSELTYGRNATWDMSATDIYDRTKAYTKGTLGVKSEIITKLGASGAGLTWSNEATAFMVVNNVDRSKIKEAGKKEIHKIVYTFDKIVITTKGETDKNWDVKENNWYGIPSEEGYNLGNQPLAYADAKGHFILEVNSGYTGKLADLFDGGNLKGFTKGNGSAIAIADIKHFISKKDITAAEDFTTINKLEKLTNVTLLENTTIPAAAFAKLKELVYVNLPKVTSVANVDAFPTNDYTEVYMGSYDFSNATGTNQMEVRDRLLKAANLVKADISAVADINAGFPKTGVTFGDYKKLKEISVKKGVLIGAAAFKGCVELTLVQYPKGVEKGYVTLMGNNVFENCAKLGGHGLFTYNSISISNLEVPAYTFKGCTALANITGVTGDPIQPTAIEISAFEGCGLLDMDLSKAATIGAAAFKDCRNLRGNDNVLKGRTVLYVNAVTHVSDNVFENCANIQFISFANATTIGVEFLKGAKCEEIEFLKAFTVDSAIPTAAGTNFFGFTTFASNSLYNTKLFCNKAQTGVSGNTISLKGNANGSVATTPAEFGGTIVKKY